MDPHSPAFVDAGLSLEEPARRDGADSRAVLMQRLRTAVAMVACMIVVTTVVDVPAGEVPPRLLLQLKAVDLLALAAIYALSRWTVALRQATVFACGVAALLCAGAAVSGIATGDSQGAVILCVGTALLAAAFLPWGMYAQLTTVVCGTVAIALNCNWLPSPPADPVSYQAVAAALLALAVSLVIAYERQTTWSAMRRENQARASAEARTATLHQHLERMVEQRTALLDATRTDLQRHVAGHAATLQMLRDKERQLLDIVDNSSAHIYVQDLHGRYRFIGIQSERFFGVSRDQLIGKTVADLFPAEAAAEFAAIDRAVLASNQAVESEDTLAGPAGPQTFLTLKFPLRDPAGATYGLCGISTEITERKQIEAELRRAEALLSSVIESTDEAIWSLDRDYRFTALNMVVRRHFRELFGREPEVGMSIDECLPAETVAYWRGRIAQALAGEQVVVEQTVTVGGALRELLVSLNPISEEGVVTGVVFFTKEVTAIKQAAERLRHRQAELAHALRLSTIGEMATGLAHSLRGPLAVIAGTARECRQLLQFGRLDAERLLPRLGQITAAALGAAESLRRLRSLVRKEGATSGTVDLNDAARDAARIVEVRHPEVPLRLVLAPNLPPVQGDRIQLVQVVLNLLLNGLDALQAVRSEQRTLVLRTGRTGSTAVEVTVCDTGSGVDPAMGDTLFAPFVTTKPNGLGMGLAIGRSIVEAHGGRLWTTPNPEGGSTFHFTLPLP
jgi:PAS domain S-box-containing protein